MKIIFFSIYSIYIYIFLWLYEQGFALEKLLLFGFGLCQLSIPLMLSTPRYSITESQLLEYLCWAKNWFNFIPHSGWQSVRHIWKYIHRYIKPHEGHSAHQTAQSVHHIFREQVLSNITNNYIKGYLLWMHYSILVE